MLEYKLHLLDYFIAKDIVDDLLVANQLNRGAIDLIEADLFHSSFSACYDLVFSCGLIEHFEDTADIIKRHVLFLNKGGILFITLPNFTGINGWFQQLLDKENYDKHNIACMNPIFLTQIFKELGLENIQSGYYGRFSIWLEYFKKQPILIRLLFKLCWFTGKVFTKIFRFDSRFLSPYIIIQGKKGD